MAHLPALIQDLGIILITAALTTLLFKWLRQPVVLGYLVAGFLVGPHFEFVFNVVDTKSVHVWAEIGVIFLLFGLGLEFSFKKLAKVGKSSAIAALFEIVTMTSVGYLLGQALGWNSMDSLFLGAILSMSSTTIIIRAFNELGLKAKGFVSLVFGILIVEDLAAILILVLLTTIASPESVSGGHLAFSTLRLGFFLLLWFLVGIYFVPVLLRKIRNLLSDETLLIISIGLCLMMVILATKVGFSHALGAFVMGSILAETREGTRIEHIMLPVRDLFAAVFFVSVGMMIDPHVLIDNAGVILIIIAVTIVGKLFGSGLGALLSGRPLKQSMQAGLSLAQIGEFSFLIAALGESLKVTSPFVYPIVIAVSAVTTFTTPYMIKFSSPICDWLERHIPHSARERLRSYELMMSSDNGRGGMSLLWREHGIGLLINTVMVIGISLLISRLALTAVTSAFGQNKWISIVACILALGACAPFIRAIFLGASAKPKDRSPSTLRKLKRLNFAVVSIRLVWSVAMVGFIISQFTNVQTFFGTLLVALAAVPVLFSRYSDPLYRTIENRFLTNLNDKEVQELEENRPELAPWEASIVELTLSPDSELVGKTLEASAFKERTGATIAMIERGSRRIISPDRSAVLMPHDRLSIVGTDEQLARARGQIEVNTLTATGESDDSIGLESIYLPEGSRFIDKTIRDCGLREEVNGLIVGVERAGERILNPDSTMILRTNDRLWIVGDKAKVRALRD